MARISYIIFLFVALSYFSTNTLRDPFSFGTTETISHGYKCKAIGQMHSTSKSFAILQKNGKSSIVFVGQNLDNYNITEIKKDYVKIKDKKREYKIKLESPSTYKKLKG